MALKFCFKHEIHRCSELPENFKALTPFLVNKFKVALPLNFSLYYINSEDQRISIASEEDFRQLVERNSKKPIKVFIAEQDGAEALGSQTSIIEDISSMNSDYGVIQSQSSKSEGSSEIIQQEEEEQGSLKPLDSSSIQNKVVEDCDPLVGQLSEELVQKHIIPRLEECKVSDSIQGDVQKVVRESLQDQMPYIISQIREALNQEKLIKQQEIAEASQKDSDPAPVQKEEIGSEVEIVKGEEDDKGFLAKVISSIKEFPGKAMESIDKLAHEIEGDPYVYIDGKKFTTSTVVKAEQIHLFFPDQDKSEILSFVQGFPRQLVVDKIAELYMNKKEL